MQFPYVKKSTHDAVVAERDALQSKLDRIMKPLRDANARRRRAAASDRIASDAGAYFDA